MSSVTRRHEWADPERERQVRAPSKIKINVVHRRSHRSTCSLARSRIAHALSAPPSAEVVGVQCRLSFPSLCLSLSLMLSPLLIRVAYTSVHWVRHVYAHLLVPFSFRISLSLPTSPIYLISLSFSLFPSFTHTYELFQSLSLSVSLSFDSLSLPFDFLLSRILRPS